MNYSDDQAQHDRAFLGEMRYIRVPAPPQPDYKKLRQQRQREEQEREDKLRSGIPVSRNYQMTYERIHVGLPKQELEKQIALCRKELAFHQEQWRRVQDFPGDLTVYRLNLKNSQIRLDNLLEQLAQRQQEQ